MAIGLIVSSFSVSLMGQESSFDEVATESYVPPSAIKRSMPEFPRSEHGYRTEAWVWLRYMVDTDGRPHNIEVADSMGRPQFHFPAVSALKKWRYKPATLNGKPINAMRDVKVIFQYDPPARGARGGFVRNYNEIKTLINADREDEAKAELDNLRDIARNLYEFSWLGVAEFSFNQKWGSKKDQLESINLAIAYEPRSGYLPEDSFVAALANKFRLQVELKHYQSALNTYEVFKDQESVTEPTKQQLKSYVSRINDIKRDKIAFSIVDEITEGGYWSYRLLWNRFNIDAVEGAVSEIRLYCDRAYLVLPYDNEMVYNVDRERDQGGCWVYVYGLSGTNVTLNQI